MKTVAKHVHPLVSILLLQVSPSEGYNKLPILAWALVGGLCRSGVKECTFSFEELTKTSCHAVINMNSLDKDN